MDSAKTFAASDNWYGDNAATFGDRLAGGREALGLSQDELSRKLGVKLKTIVAWENDISEPRANKLQMAAGLLNVSVMWLLTGHGDGLHGPMNEKPLPEDAAGLLIEIRRVKGEFSTLTEHLGALEKQLRGVLKR